MYPPILSMFCNQALFYRKTCEFQRTASWMCLDQSGPMKDTFDAQLDRYTVGRREMGPCHFDLGKYEAGTVAVINFIQTEYEQSHGLGSVNEFTHAERALYLSWLANRSPYKDAFIEKDGAYMDKVGFCLMTGFVAGNILGAAVVATRRLWEHTSVLAAWLALVERGVEENLAFCIAHSLEGRGDKGGNFSWNNQGKGHTSMDACNVTAKYIHNFVLNKPVSKSGFFSDTGVYRGYCDMFDGGRGGYINQLTKNWKPDGKPEGAGNPFAKRNNLYSVSFKKAIDDMVAEIPQIKKDCELV